MKLRAALLLFPLLAAAAPLGSEIPEHFNNPETSFDHVRQDVMVPMRDGVKLHTVILIPKGATHVPILFTRTPYSANELTTLGNSAHLNMQLDGYDNNDVPDLVRTYIRVVQDVRGKYGSEGEYLMNRPPAGPLNHSGIDESTDTYDTIDWLVKHLKQSNGRVGTIGISYDGWTTLMSLIHPHPALKVAVPMNSMVDGWIGDDWFHRGAFRVLGTVDYVYEQEATRDSSKKWWIDHYDDYDTLLAAGNADNLARSHGLEQLGFWNKLEQHPAYDQFWQAQAVDKLLAKEPLTVPMLLVHSLWDQEDIYGNIAVYKALKPKDTDNSKVFLAMGPWHHGGELGPGSSLSTVPFNSDTGRYFRTKILAPFLDHYLKDDAPPLKLAPVTAFETGTNHWQRLTAWPSGCPSNCKIETKPLHLLPGGAAALDRTAPEGTISGTYVSDPAKPVPFIQRPIHLLADGEGITWRDWLSSDQREASTRPDVLTFTTDRLTQKVKIAGEPVANIVASTTGTDGDFVVKLIDVFPDEVPQTPALGGYQLMVSADILRGRYRQAYDKPSPIPPNQNQTYRFALPTVNHVFLPGHRIMVQVQSSWFPLYDRNPQSYVDNIFTAKPEAYKAATIKLSSASAVELPVVSGP